MTGVTPDFNVKTVWTVLVVKMEKYWCKRDHDIHFEEKTSYYFYFAPTVESEHKKGNHHVS